MLPLTMMIPRTPVMTTMPVVTMFLNTGRRRSSVATFVTSFSASAALVETRALIAFSTGNYNHSSSEQNMTGLQRLHSRFFERVLRVINFSLHKKFRRDSIDQVRGAQLELKFYLNIGKTQLVICMRLFLQICCSS